MNIYLFTDLDDTLFQTLRKCGMPESCTPETAATHGLSVASWSREGQALSYMLPRQRRFLELFGEARIIPVTARNADAFHRVNLPFSHGAVLNYGGTVLRPDGSEDLLWQARMRDRLARWQEPLHALETALKQWAGEQGLAVRIRSIGHGDGLFYVVIKNAQEGVCVLPQVQEAGAALLERQLGWCVHRNDNNLAFIPEALNKSHGVQYLMDSYLSSEGDFMSIGMGDSLVDINFMSLCDYMVTPRCSQIQRNCLNGDDFFGKL